MKEQRTIECIETMRTWVNKVSGATTCKAVDNFGDEMTTMGKSVEEDDDVEIFTEKLTQVFEKDLDKLLTYKGGSSKDTTVVMTRIGKVIFKEHAQYLEATKKQVEEALKILPVATLLIVSSQLGDSAGNVQWEAYTKAISKEIKERAKCTRAHADCHEGHGDDVSMGGSGSGDGDGGDDDHGGDGGGDGKKKVGRPRKDTNAKTVTAGVKNLRLNRDIARGNCKARIGSHCIV